MNRNPKHSLQNLDSCPWRQEVKAGLLFNVCIVPARKEGFWLSRKNLWCFNQQFLLSKNFQGVFC